MNMDRWLKAFAFSDLVLAPGILLATLLIGTTRHVIVPINSIALIACSALLLTLGLLGLGRKVWVLHFVLSGLIILIAGVAIGVAAAYGLSSGGLPIFALATSLFLLLYLPARIVIVARGRACFRK